MRTSWREVAYAMTVLALCLAALLIVNRALAQPSPPTGVVMLEPQGLTQSLTPQPWAVWYPQQGYVPAYVVIRKWAPLNGRVCFDSTPVNCRTVEEFRKWVEQRNAVQ